MAQLLLNLQFFSLLFLVCNFFNLTIGALALKVEYGEHNSLEDNIKDRNDGWEWNRRHKDDEHDKFRCPPFNFVTPFRVFTDKQDCSYFYYCFFNKVYRRKCPHDYQFDMFMKRCLSEALAVCDTRTDVFRCTSWLGRFPDQKDCSIYYECRFFQAQLQYCPQGTLYDVHRKYCTPESHVNCGSRERPKTPQLSTTKGPVTAQLVSSTEKFKTTEKQTTSTKNILTTNKDTTTEEPTTEKQTTQPASTKSSKPTGPPEITCLPEDFDCIIKDTGEISEWFECQEGMGSYPHPSSTKLFIYCRDGKPRVKKCGQNRIFSTQTKNCIMPKQLYTIK